MILLAKSARSTTCALKNEHICAVLQGQETILPDAVKKAIRDAAQLHAKDILGKLRISGGFAYQSRHLYWRRKCPC